MSAISQGAGGDEKGLDKSKEVCYVCRLGMDAGSQFWNGRVAGRGRADGSGKTCGNNGNRVETKGLALFREDNQAPEGRRKRLSFGPPKLVCY